MLAGPKLIEVDSTGHHISILISSIPMDSRVSVEIASSFFVSDIYCYEQLAEHVIYMKDYGSPFRNLIWYPGFRVKGIWIILE